MRSKKKYFIVLVLLLIVGISIGFAVLNATLIITGKSSISKNTWDVHFENVKVTTGSVEAKKVPTIENDTTVDFEVQLNLPGDFYEFTVDVVNDGTIDAMIESITKEPELTDDQNKYLNYTVEYQNGEQLATKQLVKANEYVRVKVRVELRKDIAESDLPEVGDVLNLGFTLNYVQSDGTGSSVTDNGVVYRATANGSLDEIGTIVTIGSEQFYTIGTEGDNVKLLAMYNLYVGNEVQNVVFQDEGMYWDTADITSNKIANPTGLQSKSARGFVENEFPFIGTTAFSDNTPSYSGSILEGYAISYKKEINKLGVAVIESRFITYDELTDSKTFACVEYEFCSDRYPWVYSTTYWTGTADDVFGAWYMNSDGYFDYDDCFNAYRAGVRPVIVIPKSEIKVEEKRIIEFSIGNTNYQAEEGMTWEKFVSSEYNDGSVSLSDIFAVSNGLLFENEEGQDQISSDVIQDGAVYKRAGELPPM